MKISHKTSYYKWIISIILGLYSILFSEAYSQEQFSDSTKAYELFENALLTDKSTNTKVNLLNEALLVAFKNSTYPFIIMEPEV